MRYLIQCSLKRINFQTRILTTMGHGLMVPKSRKIFSPRSVFQLTKQTHFENNTGPGNRVKVMSRVSRLIFFATVSPEIDLPSSLPNFQGCPATFVL